VNYSPSSVDDMGMDDPRRFLPIQYLGSNATGIIRAMRLYYEAGRAFSEGCHSLRDVGKRLEALQIQGVYANDLPYSVASVQRACVRMEEFFQRHFDLTKRPKLLKRTGDGMPFAGFTELGWDAWRLTEAYLLLLGVLETS